MREGGIMQAGMIGLGRMGMNMVRRLMRAGHEVIVFNRTQHKVDMMVQEGALGASSLEDFIQKLSPPRHVWLMLPIGGPIDEHIDQLQGLLQEDDCIIDGGNSFYKDDIRRANILREQGLHYIDAGVSGGVWGLDIGYCTMVGGKKSAVERIEPLLQSLAPEEGYLHCGEVGSGHFVKMVHNGIEYALMEAYGEGFEILKASPYAETIHLDKIAKLWNRGSVVRSWLLELLENALQEDPELEKLHGYVEDSGEGRWTVQQAVESGVSATAIAHAVFKRFESRQNDVFSNKILAALRSQFGGHAIMKQGESRRENNAGAGFVEAAQAGERWKD
jgi:6-phosphogluconate dehydrogenase